MNTQKQQNSNSTVAASNNDDDSKRYIILPDKMDFRKIGKIMTKAGYDMNHATARNQVVAAMKEVLNLLAKDLRSEITLEQISDLVSDQEIHQVLQEVLYLAYKELKQEETSVSL